MIFCVFYKVSHVSDYFVEYQDSRFPVSTASLADHQWLNFLSNQVIISVQLI